MDPEAHPLKPAMFDAEAIIHQRAMRGVGEHAIAWSVLQLVDKLGEIKTELVDKLDEIKTILDHGASST